MVTKFTDECGVCPICGSTEIEYGLTRECDESRIYIDAQCLGCGADLTICYEITFVGTTGQIEGE